MTEKAALARARRALGMTDGEPVASGVEGVRRLIEAVEARLGEIEPDDRELVEARAAHAEQLERLAGRYEARARRSRPRARRRRHCGSSPRRARS